MATESVIFAIAVILRNKNHFKEALLEAVNSGGDTDTIASIVGGFIGWTTGYSGIPDEWKTILPQTNFLLDISDIFYKQFGQK